MTLKDEVKAMKSDAKEIRESMETRGGNDPDVTNTLLYAILQELRKIKEKP